MRYYCGIDVSNKESAICVISEQREVVKEVVVKTRIAELLSALSEFGELKCVVETAPLSEWVCEVLEGGGHKIDIVCARKAKAIMASKGRKTDKRDARALAELCCSGWYEPIHRKSGSAREMRSYLTARKQLVKNCTAMSASIRGIFRAHGIKFEAGTSEDSFALKIRVAARRLPPLSRKAVLGLLRTFELSHKEQRRMYKELKSIGNKRKEIKRLMTVPGVGAATAAAFVATIDDPTRFANGDKVAAYVGLAPSVYQSGETEYRGRVTKQGDALLRWLLVEAAHSLLTRSRSNCALRSWGLRLQEVKGPGKARVAVARKLCGILWSLWIKQIDFQVQPATA